MPFSNEKINIHNDEAEQTQGLGGDETVELVLRAKNGDLAAKEAIYRAYKPLVRSICNNFYLIGGDKDDLLQEGMIGLFDAVETFDPSRGAFPSFARLCVKRHIQTAITQASRRHNEALAAAAALSTIDNLVQPMDAVLERDTLSALKTFININLTKTEKEALEYFLSGFSYDEICQKTGKKYKAVDSALQRARKKISVFQKS